MAHTWTFDKLMRSGQQLNPSIRGKNSRYTPKFEISHYTSGPHRGQKVIVPFMGTKSVLISMRAWGVTQASLHNVTLMFSNVEILKEDPKSNGYFQIEYDGQMYWIQKFDRFRHPLTTRCTCFTGDTQVLLADGTYKTFKELEGKEFQVWTYDSNRKEYKISKATNCGLKLPKAEVIKLCFSDGYSVRCTPDHVFVLEDDTEIQAKDTLNKSLKCKNGKITVNNIEILEEYEDVYCLTVEETGKFLLKNGLVILNCADYFYRFAWYNYYNAHCLYGPAPRAYQKKTNRPPQNPRKLPGICKHIINAWEILANSGLTVN